MEESVRRCHATILFSDICGSTQLAEKYDPEVVAETLSQIRAVAEKIVAAHDGLINQFYGDGILAVFGFDKPSEEDIQKATVAALELHQTIANLSINRAFATPERIRLHSGIHADLIVVQEGDLLQGRYKLYGDALNTASRLADAAGEDEIFASASTVAGVLPYFLTEPVEPLSLRGKALPVDAYRILGQSSVATRFEASQLRGLTPFIGRVSELDECASVLRSALEGQIKITTIIGDAGLGKTRLVDEFLSSLVADEYHVFKGYCQNDIDRVPFQPFVDLLRQIMRIEPTSTLEQIGEAIFTYLEEVDHSWLPHHDKLLQFLGATLSKNSRTRNKPTEAQTTANLLVDFFVTQAWQKPVIITIDDWHWADENSRLLILKLLQIELRVPVMILLASRFLDPDDPANNGQSINLQPFSINHSRQSIYGLIPNQFDLDIAAEIHHRSGGNILFIEELCLSLSNNKESGSGSRTLINIPATLHGLIEVRIKKLPQQYADLVKIASVLGRIFPQDLLEKVLGHDVNDNTLVQLGYHDLIYRANTEGMLRFKHGITRDVIYNSVVLKQRQMVHAKVADILNKDGKINGGLAHLETMTYHYFGAAENDIAINYAEQAGDKALAVSSLDCARHHYLLALTQLREKPQTPAVMEQWINICMRWAIACTYKPAKENLAILEHAAKCAVETGNLNGLAQTKYSLGWIHYVLGDPLQSIRCLEEGLLVAKDIADDKLAAQIVMTIGQSHTAAGNYRAAMPLLNQAIDIKQRVRSVSNPPVGFAYGVANKALIVADRGDFIQADVLLQEALASLKDVDHVIEGSVLAIYGVLLLWQGRWQTGLEVAKRHKLVCAQYSATQSYAIGCVVEYYADWMLNGDRQAVEKLGKTIDWLTSNGFYMYASIFIAWYADALTATGNFGAAKSYAEHALVRANLSDIAGEPMAYRTLALLAAQQDAFDFDQPLAAPEYYLDLAMKSAQARQSLHDVAVNQMHLAKFLWLTNRQEESRRALVAAINGFTNMDMPWHLNEAKKLAAEHASTAGLSQV
ncbi:MAG: AAA family ATPase [Pseudomonadales bacterium]|nr:AAA family ATPase [Pseudomonadales bacterium]